MNQASTTADQWQPSTYAFGAARLLSFNKRKSVLMILCILFSLHAAFRGTHADYDAHAYADFYERLSALSFHQFWDGIEGDSLYYSVGASQRFEIGFAVLSYIISRLSSEPAWYFFALCFISLDLKAWAINRLSVAPSLSILWYFSWYYLLLEMNAVRAGIAAGILLVATQPLVEKKYASFCGYVLVATLFHSSSLVAAVLPILAVVRLRPAAMLFVLALSVFSGFVDIGQFIKIFGALNTKLGEYYELMTTVGLYSTLNRFNVIVLLRVLVFLLLLWNYDKLTSVSYKYSLFIKLYLASLVAYFMLSSFPVLGSRLYELLGVYQVLGAALLLVALRRRLFAYVLVVAIASAQFYALAYHSRLVDFFYFIGEPYLIEAIY